jgi:hypothetical protein
VPVEHRRDAAAVLHEMPVAEEGEDDEFPGHP